MPAGDRSRTWFPEMIHELQRAWRSDLGMDELIALAQSLDRLLQEIRTERRIRPVMLLCRECGERAPAAAPRVSVRAMILAAGRFGIGTQTDVEQLERRWKRHSAKERLDRYGSPSGESRQTIAAEAGGCHGSQGRS